MANYMDFQPQGNGKYAFSRQPGEATRKQGARFSAKRAFAPAVRTRPTVAELWSDGPAFRIRNFFFSGDLRNTPTEAIGSGPPIRRTV